MAVNNENINQAARQIAQALIAVDIYDKDASTISKSIWDRFADGKGNGIRSCITIQNAESSIRCYLRKISKSIGESISELTQKWITQISTYNSEQNSDATESSEEKDLKLISGGNQLTESSEPEAGADKNADLPVQEEPVLKEVYVPDVVRRTPGKIARFDTDTIYEVDPRYARMVQSEADVAAAKDPRLERLEEYGRVKIAEKQFRTDVPYARGNTVAILNFIAEKMKIPQIIITSALGSRGKTNSRGRFEKSPHVKGNISHHNANNPKIDIHNQKGLESKLRRTKMFSRVSNEGDHLDIQIKPEVYIALNNGYSLEDVYKAAQSNNLSSLV